MPFVVCASQGGPHDDGPFVAGYECGWLDATLAAGPDTVSRYMRADSLPQVDLIAMRHGYTVTSTPWDEHPDEWTWVELVRAS